MLSEMVIYDTKAILQILPHRPPFLLVDTIIELEPAKRIVGIKQVTINEPFFPGTLSRNAGNAGRSPDRSARAGRCDTCIART
jgi:hypothetical protein